MEVNTRVQVEHRHRNGTGIDIVQAQIGSRPARGWGSKHSEVSQGRYGLPRQFRLPSRRPPPGMIQRSACRAAGVPWDTAAHSDA